MPLAVDAPHEHVGNGKKARSTLTPVRLFLSFPWNRNLTKHEFFYSSLKDEIKGVHKNLSKGAPHR